MKRLFVLAAMLIGASGINAQVDKGCMHAFTKGSCVLYLQKEAPKKVQCDVDLRLTMSDGKVFKEKTTLYVYPGLYSTATIEVVPTGEVIRVMEYSKSCKS